MKELDPLVFFYVFREMLGTPLLILFAVLIVGGALAFISLLVREKGFRAERMLRCQGLGLPGGVLALIIMARVSSSGFNDAGGPVDWLLIALVFGAGLVGTTIIAYSAAGWWKACRKA